MSDIGKLRRPGSSPFPTVRKSADPFQPEMGEMDFSQDLNEFEAEASSTVRETEKAEQNVIMDENRQKQFRQRKRKKKKEEEEEKKAKESADSFIDLQA